MTRAPALVWVVGRGGLLGSHVIRALGCFPALHDWPDFPAKLVWNEPETVRAQLARAVRSFSCSVRAGYGRWAVVWAAGCGVIGTPREALQAETRVWRALLDLLGEYLLDGPAAVPGTVFLASSAGGVYGAGSGRVLTEDSPPAPISDYGHEKLVQEQLLDDWGRRWPRGGFVVGRIATLYGPGQNLAKPQGLIAHLSRCLIHQRPLSVFVPLDTIRDYVHAADCAELVLRYLERAADAGPGCRAVKVLASGEPVSVAKLLGLFRRLVPRAPRILCAPKPATLLHGRKVYFRSVVWPDLRPEHPTPLICGLKQVHQDQLDLFRRGLLPPAPIPPRPAAGRVETRAG